MIKRYLLFLGLLGFGFGFSSAFAMKVDVQVERTPQVPGFLAVTVFPPAEATPQDMLLLEEVYVQNYPQEEAKKYQELLQLIREFGGKIVPASQSATWYQKPYTRTISLGDETPLKSDFTFIPEGSSITESFVQFAEENLHPVYLQSLSLVGEDENFIEVLPHRISFLSDEPVTFIGKFKEEKPMNIILQAYGPTEPLQARIKVNLAEVKLKSTDLASQWEDLQKGLMQEKTSGGFWFNGFPFILAILGIACLGLAMRLKKKEKEQDPVPHFIRQLHQTIDNETLPFDLEAHQRDQVHKVRNSVDSNSVKQ